jgi:hypothetical protein
MTVDDKLDKIDERLDTISITMERNTASLDEHIRRTEIIEQELKPVKDHVNLVNASAKIGSALLALLLALKELEII